MVPVLIANKRPSLCVICHFTIAGEEGGQLLARVKPPLPRAAPHVSLGAKALAGAVVSCHSVILPTHTHTLETEHERCRRR